LCMFHDTLPGSSIHIAVEDYDRKFAAIHKTAKELFDEATRALGGSSDSKSVINTLPSHPRKEVVSLGNGEVGVAEVNAHTICGKAEKYEPSESEGVTGMS
jgi:alpha-mannosidase